MENNSNEQSNVPVPTSTNTEQTTPESTTTEPKQSEYTFNEITIMASLSYLGPLVLIPFLTKKNDTFVMFHVKQGLVLFGIEIGLMFITMLSMGILAPIVGLINIGLLVLSVIGILNALKKEEKEIPLVGKFSAKITL